MKAQMREPIFHWEEWNEGQRIWSLMFILFFDWLHSSLLGCRETVLKTPNKMTNCTELHMEIWSYDI